MYSDLLSKIRIIHVNVQYDRNPDEVYTEKKPQKEIKMNEGYANYNVMKTLWRWTERLIIN